MRLTSWAQISPNCNSVRSCAPSPARSGFAHAHAIAAPVLTPGQKAFMHRALDKANGRRNYGICLGMCTFCLHVCVCRFSQTIGNAAAAVAAAPAGDQQASTGCAIRALIDEVRREEVKTHVDIDAKVKVRCPCMLLS